MDTRLEKLKRKECDGLILAAAGLLRIGLISEITSYFSVDEMIPAPGQGTLAIELRADDTGLLEMLNALSSDEADAVTKLERGFLSAVGGDCKKPIGAYAKADGSGYSLTDSMAPGMGAG